MRDINLLHPDLLRLYLQWAAKMEKFHLPFTVTCTLRTQEEHKALYAQGREPLEEVNRLRALAGMYLLTEKENSRPVTWTRHTRHFADSNGFAQAFDIALIYPGTKRLHWNEKVSVNSNELADYNEAAIYAREVGLKPGIDFRDPCHFELPSYVQ